MNQIPFRLYFVSGEENIKDDVKKKEEKKSKKNKLIMKMFFEIILSCSDE